MLHRPGQLLDLHKIQLDNTQVIITSKAKIRGTTTKPLVKIQEQSLIHHLTMRIMTKLTTTEHNMNLLLQTCLPNSKTIIIGKLIDQRRETIARTSVSHQGECVGLLSVEALGEKAKEGANTASIFFHNCLMKNMTPILVAKAKEREVDLLVKVKEEGGTPQVEMVKS